MLNALFPKIPWKKIACVGFDLDGTLYDEFSFITQVYRSIVEENSCFFQETSTPLNYMLSRWLQKGSSYNMIFEETFHMFAHKNDSNKKLFTNNAINIFRNFIPNLVLSERTKYILSNINNLYDIFLITDGGYKLQKSKFDALGLNIYFKKENILFTGKIDTSIYLQNKLFDHWDVVRRYE